MIALSTRLAEPRPDMPLAEFLRKVYIPVKLLGKRRKTINLYRHAVHAMEKILGRPPCISDLNDQSVAHVLSALLKSQKPVSVNSIRSFLMALGNYAAKKRFLDVAPDVPRILEDPPDPTAWSFNEFTRILAAARACANHGYRAMTAEKWEALLLLLYYTGLRIGAVLKLRVSDLDLPGRILGVRSSTQKNGRGLRFILPDDCVAACRRVLPDDPDAYLLVGLASTHDKYPPLSVNNLRTAFKEVLVAAGLPHGRREMFHKIRRTTGKIGKANGGNATAILDHSSTRLTEERYTGREPLDMRFMPSPGPSPEPPAALDFGTFTTYVG